MKLMVQKERFLTPMWVGTSHPYPPILVLCHITVFVFFLMQLCQAQTLFVKGVHQSRLARGPPVRKPVSAMSIGNTVFAMWLNSRVLRVVEQKHS